MRHPGAVLLLSCCTAACAGATPRGGPVPAATGGAAPRVALPAEFAAAVTRGTRTPAGSPGPAYWQNFASYTISARVDPARRRLEGRVEIEYRNNSPDTLHALHLQLTQNLHASGVERDEAVEITGGMELRSVVVRGRALGSGGEGARYLVAGTRLAIHPDAPVLPGTSVAIAIEYGFRVPESGAGARMGVSDDLLYLAYWYPQLAVYDDVVGWHTDPFLGTAEFYAGFANYRYFVDVPAGWVLLGTGTLENAPQVLRPAVRERLQRAAASDGKVAVVSPGDFPRNVTVATSGRVTWQFRADSVRDVAFGMMRTAHWDARRAAVGDRDGDGRTDYALVNALYRRTAPRWRQAADHGAHALTFLSQFTGQPYPWPHLSAVEGEGIIGGGMEYPMMTLISSYTGQSDAELYSVLAHEIAHMWVPMLLSTDERRYSWLDEGTTTFNENQARAARYPGSAPWLGEQEQYLLLEGSPQEGEIMRRSGLHRSRTAFGIASYAKPAAVLQALRAVLGDSVFLQGYRTFLEEWRYRHPYPWDFWHTFERASGQDLDWFWYPWYFTTWALDQAIGEVTANAGETRITVVNRGRIIMPANLTITLASGATVRRTVPAAHWLSADTATVALAGETAVRRIELDAERHFPDTDRRNNVWTR